MLSKDIDDINEMIGVVPECEPYRESWQRIKTALAELGTMPNSAMVPCPWYTRGNYRCRVGFRRECGDKPCLLAQLVKLTESEFDAAMRQVLDDRRAKRAETPTTCTRCGEPVIDSRCGCNRLLA